MPTGERVGEQRQQLPLPSSAAVARDQVARLLDDRFRPSPEDPRHSTALADALLVTSELVTNAIRHGGGVCGFSAHVTDAGLVLSVSDRSGRIPRTIRPSNASAVPVGGYGWPLILRLAEEVDVSPRREGKNISVLLRLP
ncbi:ATP-binding protein [Streptomyces sp. NPDC057445]|uniref:ATP-binding protein n=1 Tax=Streptomyces sp. NPDC057445 TaxID=3346136 RepID=UPI0036CE9D8E